MSETSNDDTNKSLSLSLSFSLLLRKPLVNTFLFRYSINIHYSNIMVHHMGGRMRKTKQKARMRSWWVHEVSIHNTPARLLNGFRVFAKLLINLLDRSWQGTRSNHGQNRGNHCQIFESWEANLVPKINRQVHQKNLKQCKNTSLVSCTWPDKILQGANQLVKFHKMGVDQNSCIPKQTSSRINTFFWDLSPISPTHLFFSCKANLR